MAFEADDDSPIETGPSLSLADREAIQNLWGMGFTVVSRQSAEKLYDAVKIPAGFAYQWHANPEVAGWTPVVCSRHPGMFAPFGTNGAVELGGLYLMERPRSEVEAALKANEAKAHKNVDDWFARQGAAGFTGGVTILSESSQAKSAQVVDIGQSTERTKIPADLYEHLAELLRERDRLVAGSMLVAASMKASLDTLTGAVPDIGTLRASCLRLAIAALRNKYNHQPLIDEKTKTIEDEALIPDDLLPHASTLFEVRDALWQQSGEWWNRDGRPEYRRYQELLTQHPDWTRGQLMNAVLLPIAVQKTREMFHVKQNAPEGRTDGASTEH